MPLSMHVAKTTSLERPPILSLRWTSTGRTTATCTCSTNCASAIRKRSRTVYFAVFREGRELFYGVDNILAAAAFSMEDDALLDIALRNSGRHDVRAEAIASVLGPQAVGKMIDAYLIARTRPRDANGRYDQAASNRYYALSVRIGHTLGACLVAAVQARADSATDEQIADLAELFSRDTNGDNERARSFNEEGLVAISALGQKWGERLLAAENATRSQKSSIAMLVSHAPSVTLLPISSDC